MELPGLIEKVDYIFVNNDNGYEFKLNDNELLPSNVKVY